MSANTALLYDIDGSGSSNPGGFASTGSRVYFVANGDTVYSTDGTTLSNHVDVFPGTVPAFADKPLGVISNVSYVALIDTTMETRLVRGFFNVSTPTFVFVKSFSSSSTFSSLIPYGTSDVAFVEENSPLSQSHVWRSNGSDRGTFTIYDNDTISISRLKAFGTSLVFAGLPPNSSVFDPTTVIFSNGQAENTQPLTDVGAITSNVTLSLLDEAGDGVITGRDMNASASALVTQSVSTAGPRYQTLDFDITNAVRSALRDGLRHITLRLEVANRQVLLDGEKVSGCAGVSRGRVANERVARVKT